MSLHAAHNLTPRLEALNAKSRARQWCLETDIDWDRRLALPRWIPRRAFIGAISQLYHGELVTIRLCRLLREALADPAVRECLDLQIADETRHAAAYRGYLSRAGDLAPIDGTLAAAYDGALAWRGSELAQVVAFHVVLEGEALRLQQAFADHLPCPLFHAINEQVARDEARHLAFGLLYLRHRLPELPRDERIDIYRWVKGLWRDCAKAALSGLGGALFVTERGLAARWADHAGLLRQIGLLDAEEQRLLGAGR